MEKLLKNDKLMGFLTIATFAIVAYFAYKNYKSNQSVGTAA